MKAACLLAFTFAFYLFTFAFLLMYWSDSGGEVPSNSFTLKLPLNAKDRRASVTYPLREDGVI